MVMRHGKSHEKGHGNGQENNLKKFREDFVTDNIAPLAGSSQALLVSLYTHLKSSNFSLIYIRHSSLVTRH